MGQPNPVAVLDKAVAILRAVADEPASLAELVARTGLPRATAHRLAVALEGHRLVRRSPDGAWAPGPALAELGRGGADLAERRRPRTWSRCATPAARARSSTSARAPPGSASPPPSGTSGLRDTVPVGARLPMTAGSAAHALLAFAPADEVTRAAARPRASPPARCSTSAAAGWAHSIAEREPGVASLSAPVRDALRRRARRGVDLRAGRAARPPAQPRGRRRRARRRRRDRPRRPLTRSGRPAGHQQRLRPRVHMGEVQLDDGSSPASASTAAIAAGCQQCVVHAVPSTP